MEKIKIHLMEGGVAPQASKEEPGFELVIPFNVRVVRGKQEIPLGFSMELPKNQVALLMPREDIAKKGVLGYLNWVNDEFFNVKAMNEMVDEDRFNYINSKKEQFYIIDFSVSNINGQKIYNVSYQEKSSEPARLAVCEVERSLVSCTETGEVKLHVVNRGENPCYIQGGMCLAKMLILDIPEVEFEVYENANAGETETPNENGKKKKLKPKN